MQDEELRSLSPAARADRLEWLLRGVLEVQALITDEHFDLDAFMQRVVDLGEQLTHATGAVVELVEGDEMVYRAASTSIRGHLGLRLQRSGSLSGLCVAQATALRCDDADDDPRVDREACRTVGVRSMICAPLLRRGQAVGALKVMSSKPHAFDSSDQHLLNVMAGTIGAALGNQLALDAQRELERAKSEFIAVVSHELRTPLTSIRGSLGLVVGAMSDGLPDKVKQLLSIALDNSARLLALTDDILDIDKLASGQMKFDIREHSLASITARAWRRTKPMRNASKSRSTSRRSIPARASWSTKGATSRCCRTCCRMRRSSRRRAGDIEIETVLLPDRARISVMDRGAGIPSEFRERIFQKFSQADSSSTRRAGGTGLGLHITRQFVERMSGRIGFDARPGGGTTFWVEFGRGN